MQGLTRIGDLEDDQAHRLSALILHQVLLVSRVHERLACLDLLAVLSLTLGRERASLDVDEDRGRMGMPR